MKMKLKMELQELDFPVIAPQICFPNYYERFVEKRSLCTLSDSGLETPYNCTSSSRGYRGLRRHVLASGSGIIIGRYDY